MWKLKQLSDHYVKVLGVPPLHITKDVWPQFAYDLLTHKDMGIITQHKFPEIRATAVLFRNWVNGKVPTTRQLLDTGVKAQEASENGLEYQPREALEAAYHICMVARESTPRQMPTSDFYADQAADAFSDGSTSRKVQLQKQYNHLRALLQRPKIDEMEF